MKNLNLLYIFLLVFSHSLLAELSTDEINNLYTEASNCFREANNLVNSNPDEAYELYKKSAMRFERIAGEGGIANGKLYYNIGNAWFRMDNLGKAILYYRRALRFSPNDPNIRQNLNYARTRRKTTFELQEQKKVLKTLFFWHYDLSSMTRLNIFLTFFILSWLFAAVILKRQHPALKWLLIICIIATLSLGASLGFEEYKNSTVKEGVITARETIARKGDSETYEPVFTEPLSSGTEFTLQEKRPGWFEIKLPDGTKCWIKSSDCELLF